MCNVMSWRDCYACPHDPKVIKLNELSKFIDKKKAEITALRNERDSTLDKFFKKQLLLLRFEKVQFSKEKVRTI